MRAIELTTALAAACGLAALAPSGPAIAWAGAPAPPVETTASAPTEAPPPAEAPATTTAPAQTGTTPAPASTTGTTTGTETVPVPVPSQGPAEPAPARSPAKHKQPRQKSARTKAEEEGARSKKRAASPSALTPPLPFGLEAGLGSLPSFFAESFRFPPFLLPVYQAAGTAYEVPWQVLAAINEVETDYGRDLSVSSAGAEGWMQFLPAEWAQYGVDANGDGYRDPYNPADAIFAAARYLHAAGGAHNIKAAVYAYNHSQAYVESVMLRAQLLGATPPELLGAVTGLTEGRFPVYAPSHFGDGFASVSAGGSAQEQTIVGTTIYSQAGAPVIAVQDGEVARIGSSPQLGRFIVLRDAFGNTYTYAQLGHVAQLYPVLEPHVHSTVSSRVQPRHAEPAPSGPATAGAQPRSPLSEGAIVSGMALGAAAGLETPGSSQPAPAAPAAPPALPKPPRARFFREGSEDVYLHALRVGAQVIAGTVLGHVGAAAGAPAGGEPHIFFQIRPAGTGAPLIDPKPILDGWVALENSSVFRAKGENPFLATSPSAGQVLLESKQQLEPQVLRDAGIRLSACGRANVRSGRVDKRVLGMLEYLSVSGENPTVAGLRCEGPTSPASAAAALNAPPARSDEQVRITAVNGVPVAAHQGAGSLADETVRRLLGLQGLARPRRVVSLLGYPGSRVASASASAAGWIGVAYGPLGSARGHTAALAPGALPPASWTKLVARLGEIPDPIVSRTHSAAAIPDPAGAASAGGHG